MNEQFIFIGYAKYAGKDKVCKHCKQIKGLNGAYSLHNICAYCPIVQEKIKKEYEFLANKKDRS